MPALHYNTDHALVMPVLQRSTRISCFAPTMGSDCPNECTNGWVWVFHDSCQGRGGDGCNDGKVLIRCGFC